VSPPSQVDDFGLPPGVRDEYLQGARDQLGVIAELAERLIAAGGDMAAIEELRHEAHRLRGSAGSFGFPQASVVAAELENATMFFLAHLDGFRLSDLVPDRSAFVERLEELAAA